MVKSAAAAAAAAAAASSSNQKTNPVTAIKEFTDAKKLLGRLTEMADEST